MMLRHFRYSFYPSKNSYQLLPYVSMLERIGATSPCASVETYGNTIFSLTSRAQDYAAEEGAAQVAAPPSCHHARPCAAFFVIIIKRGKREKGKEQVSSFVYFLANAPY